MRVYERYPAWMRLYRGGLLSVLAYPLRRTLSHIHGLRPTRRSRGAGRPAGRPGDPCIISIGNIEWGGGGKTPCALALCDALLRRGFRPVVVTRGYRSEAERTGPYIVASGEATVGPEGIRCMEEEGLTGRVIGYGKECGAASLADLIGDEASLYRARGVPVVIDRRKARAVEIASRLFRPTHLILDDAFQNKDAPRDIEVLLLDHEMPFGTGELMPLGSLRERPDAVERADIVIFTRSVSEQIPPEAVELIGDKPVFFSSHRPTRLIERSGEELPIEYLRGRSVALLSGIARPESFETTIESLGVRPAASFRFADHHRYHPRDISWMLERMEGECTLVTTEKDMVKVGSLFPDGIDLVALEIVMDIQGLDRLLEYLTGGLRTSPELSRPTDTTFP
jgi:tetraacyldisaccharide 4'-kinase